jgi:GT2 family glycosyltransferase
MLDIAVNILRKNSKIGLVALKVKDVTGHKKGEPYIGGIRKTGILNCNQGVIRTDLFRKIEFFDEEFQNYGIDCDVTVKVLLSGYRIAFTKKVGIRHYRDHESKNGAISEAERAKGRDRLDKKYYAKYGFLISYNFSTKLKMRMKRIIWRCIKNLNKQMEKKGFHIETITCKNMRDWKNLTNCRYISIFDFLCNWKKPYYLVQNMSKGRFDYRNE